MNELCCPICDKTLVESWYLWDHLGDEIECCGGKWEVCYDESFDEASGECFEWWTLEAVSDLPKT